MITTNTAMPPIANRLLSKMPVFAILLLLVVEPVAAPAVTVPFMCSAVAAGEREPDADEGDGGLGHTLLYTYCSGAPLQVVADPALYVPLA